MSEDARDLEADALACIERYEAFLATPAYAHGLDVAVLTKIAGDDKVDVRERRRAAEILAKLRLQAMEGLAELTAAREVVLDRLGLKPQAQAVALTQVNQKIEIVRATDWRAAQPLAEGEEAPPELPAPPREDDAPANGHTGNGSASDPPS